jgi:L-ascorbate metabolism protein UlaG (beta-lactamase superfamily)
MRIKWFAHASFLIEGDGLRIITDPYHPDDMGFPRITESADIVIRSSADDRGHCYAEMIPGEPEVVTATGIIDHGVTVKGLKITAIPVLESIIHKDSPLDNAMYRFTVEGIRISHMGDVGNPLTDEQLAGLAGTEVLLALTSGPPTIELDALYQAIETLKPKIIIPMHYKLPGTRLKMQPITDFTRYFSEETVRWVDGAELELSRETLPAETQVVVLKSSLLQ